MKKILTFALLGLAGAALAQTPGFYPMYRNMPSFAGAGGAGASYVGDYLNAGATSGNPLTFTVADDITFAAGSAGTLIHQFWWTVTNHDTATFTARPRVRFWADDGAGGGPGTLLAAFSFNPISFTAGTIGAYRTGDLGASSWAVPANGHMWAGVLFDNSTATATFSNLNNLGQGIMNDPDIGSSQDEIWISSTAAANNVNNPTGTIFTTPFTGIHGNFGWDFDAVPEPTSMAVLGIGVLALMRRRRSR